jgi:PAS domain S-box-containing protein
MCEERLAIKERITQTLHEISEAVNTADDLNGLYAYIHQALNRIIPARNFFLALLNPDRDTISFPYEVDERSPNSSVVIAADDPRSLTVEVLRTRKPLLLHDEELSQRYDSGRNRVWNAQPRCWLGVPLIIGDRAIGVMAVQDYERGDSYGKEDVLLLESTAGQVALALERKRTEKALRENEERLRALINATPDIICFKDGEGRWLEANDADLDLFSLRGVAYHGKTDAELAGMTPPLYREAFLACEGNDDQAWQAGGISRGEERMPSSDGTTKVYDVIKVPVFAADGTRKGLVVLGRDITERKRAEEKLLASLREKEILLKEVHHRVKNNMQVICSLLSLATRSLHDPAVQDIYRESVSRIRSMALVHEKLYRSSDLSGIDFGDYLSTVTAELIRSLASGGIRCSIDAEPVFLGVDTAIPCGLIVNELVSNALKHAFLGRGEGIVQVSLRRTGEEAVEISVRDNGIGFPEGQDLRSLSSMGMTLIVSLAEQIGGTVRVEIDGGSRFVVTFPA